jgi:hypothetical protein
MTYRTSLVFAVLSASLFVGCSKRPAHGTLTSSASITIEPGVSIGPVHSGMKMQEVVTELGEPNQKHDGVLDYRDLGFAVLPGKGGIVQTVVCSGGNAQFPKAFAGHTKEGIGIGASRDEVISAYGKPSATKSGHEIEILRYDSLGVNFHIKDDKVCLIAVFFKP